MGLFDGEHHLYIHFVETEEQRASVREILARLSRIESGIQGLTQQGELIMSSVSQQLKQNMQDLRDLAQKYLDLIIAKDAAAAELAKKNEDLVNALNLSAAEKQQLLDDMAQAVTDSQATEDALRAGLPGVPPVGGEPLALSYADRASFDAAVAAYTGPEAVTVDGTEIKAGSTPSVDYFSHSADGSVNTTGPAD